VKKNLPFLGQPEGPAMIEFGAKRSFQIVDLPAQRGLFLVQRAGRRADALMGDDVKKKFQLVNVHLIARQSIPTAAISASDFNAHAGLVVETSGHSLFL
jgi:hypothetical protein